MLFDLVRYVAINPFIHNVKSWSNILKKSCPGNTDSFLSMSERDRERERETNRQTEKREREKRERRERDLTFQAPTPQNARTHSNNSLSVAYELFECVSVFEQFVRLELEGLTTESLYLYQQKNLHLICLTWF